MNVYSKSVIMCIVASFIVGGCSMKVDVSSDAQEVIPTKKPAGAEMTSGSNRQTTAGGYIVESQIGHPFGQVVSKTSGSYTVYHSLKMSGSKE